jgi:hypothetical protein
MRNIRSILVTGAGVTAAVVGGGAIANAATSSAGSSSSSSAARPATLAKMPAHGSAAHEDAETAITGDAATKAQAAAVKAAGGGTAGSVTTDYSGGGYEVTVTKSDGSTIEIHLDHSFQAMTGPPAGAGGPGGPRGAAPGA